MLFVAVGELLAILVPIAFGVPGLLGVLLIASLCFYPAAVVAYILVFKVLPPKYTTKNEVLSLFHR